MILLGLAFSLAYGPLTMAATDGIDEHEHGLAGGLLYTAIQFGTALGLSAVTAVNADDEDCRSPVSGRRWPASAAWDELWTGASREQLRQRVSGGRGGGVVVADCGDGGAGWRREWGGGGPAEEQVLADREALGLPAGAALASLMA